MLAGFMESLQSGMGDLRGGDMPRLAAATRAILDGGRGAVADGWAILRD